MKKPMKIIGARENVTKHNPDLIDTPRTTKKFEIILKEESSEDLWELHLWSEYGQYNPGQTPTSYGMYEAKKINEPGLITYTPKNEIKITIDLDDLPKDFDCSAFGWSYNGGETLPWGNAWFNHESFNKTG